MFRGLIHIPFLFALFAAFSRLRWFRFFGFVFAVVARHRLVSPSMLGLFCAAVTFLRSVICACHAATANLN